MKRLNTSKLFYGEYPYRITIAGSVKVNNGDQSSEFTVYNCRKWLDENGIDYRIYTQIKNRYRRVKRGAAMILKCSIFVKSRNHYDLCLDKWKDGIECVVEPYAEHHVDHLAGNETTVIRRKLVYGKYRYVMRFRFGKPGLKDEFEEWVDETITGRSGDDAKPSKYRTCRWSPSLYLFDDSDFVLTKLSWGDFLTQVTVVRTYDELHGCSNG